MMASSDLRIVVGSLQLAEILMQRLPEEMGVQFRREGVLHQVAQLAERPPPTTTPKQAKMKVRYQKSCWFYYVCLGSADLSFVLAKGYFMILRLFWH